MAIPVKGHRLMPLVRRLHMFGCLGENSVVWDKKLPLYSNLIFLHDNVWIAGDVHFTTHDGINWMVNWRDKEVRYVERVGPIEIMDNVFVGSGTRILYNTRIGSNVVIGANSLVNKDVPDNSVYAGVPARYICSFDDYMKKQEAYSKRFRQLYGIAQLHGVDNAMAAKIYDNFKKERS